MATIFAPSGLHAQSRLQPCKAVGRDSIDFVVYAPAVFDAQGLAIGVFAGKVEEVDASEDREEAAEQGNRIYRIGGVETAEEDEGGDKCAGRESHVVKRVHAVILDSQPKLAM